MIQLPANLVPLPLSRRGEPFDHPDWIFELKYDGFRALAVLDHGRAKLMSRNGNPFTSFADLADSIAASLPHVQHAVLDGEIVCLDADGRANFRDLLFRRGQPVFVGFDLLLAQHVDLRLSALVERKAELRRIIDRVQPGPVLFADHVEGAGVALFERACELDPRRYRGEAEVQSLSRRWPSAPLGQDSQSAI